MIPELILRQSDDLTPSGPLCVCKFIPTMEGLVFQLWHEKTLFI